MRHPLPASDEVPLSEDSEVKEVSVKSFSMAMGIRRPGFQLLSLAPPSAMPAGAATFADVPCFLPDQLGIYISVYVPLILLSVLALLLGHAYRVSQAHGARAADGQTWSHPSMCAPEKISSLACLGYYQSKLDCVNGFLELPDDQVIFIQVTVCSKTFHKLYLAGMVLLC